MRSRRKGILGAAAAALAAGLLLPGGALAAPGGEPAFSPGADGAGDPYFPSSGNGGYDVQHYHLDLTYSPPEPTVPETPLGDIRGELAGTATIDLIATANIDRFNLDLRGLDVMSVTVDGKPLRELTTPGQRGRIDGPVWWQEGDDAARRWELVVQPRPKLQAGEAAVVVVEYGGETARPRDIEGTLYGWVTTRDGAMVANEPDGAMTWYPVSDHPTDKASYSFEITVPEGTVAVANGLPSQDPATDDGWTTWFWDAPDLQASYLGHRDHR